MSVHLSLGDGVGRAALTGAAIGVVAFFCVAASIGWFGGLPPSGAAAIGAFTAVWAGPGFGAMFGAIYAITRNERLESAGGPSAISGSAAGWSGGRADGS
jgi:hypothetical protein